MPLFQYFNWVGSFLLAALFAVGWWPPGNVPMRRVLGAAEREHPHPDTFALFSRPEPRIERFAESQDRPPALAPSSIEGGERPYCPQSVSQAARKKLTRSRTNFGTSF
jgi:hypothetical protein